MMRDAVNDYDPASWSEIMSSPAEAQHPQEDALPAPEPPAHNHIRTALSQRQVLDTAAEGSRISMSGERLRACRGRRR